MKPLQKKVRCLTYEAYVFSGFKDDYVLTPYEKEIHVKDEIVWVTTENQVNKEIKAIENKFKWNDETLKNVVKNHKKEIYLGKITWEEAYKELTELYLL